MPVEVENQLIDHHYFGIRNILALRGDPPDGQPKWKAKDGGYDYAYQLMEQIRNLNKGSYLPRRNDPGSQNQEPTSFCIGGAAYPDMADEHQRISYFKRKVEAGAEYGITDMLFDPESYARFLDSCGKNNINVPILPGTRILKSQDQVQKMLARFKVNVPKKLIDSLPEKDGPDCFERSIDLFVEFAERLNVLGAPGIHVFVIGDTSGACEALRRLAEGPKKVRYVVEGS